MAFGAHSRYMTLLSLSTFRPSVSYPYEGRRPSTLVTFETSGVDDGKVLRTLLNFSSPPSESSIDFNHALALACRLLRVSWNGESHGSSLTTPFWRQSAADELGGIERDISPVPSVGYPLGTPRWPLVTRVLADFAVTSPMARRSSGSGVDAGTAAEDVQLDKEPKTWSLREA